LYIKTAVPKAVGISSARKTERTIFVDEFQDAASKDGD
jgi:hypothetical protein